MSILTLADLSVDSEKLKKQRAFRSHFRGVKTERKTGGDPSILFPLGPQRGNKMLAKIHNNPKLEGPGMPLILPQELEDKWLNPIEAELNVQSIQELIKEYPDDELDSYTVRHEIIGEASIADAILDRLVHTLIE